MNVYLSRHPSIFMAQKELHYFSREAFYGPSLDKRDLTWYLKNFSDAGDKLLCGEASVWYLSSEIAARQIKAFDPRAKIIIHVRNPIDLIVSYHSELLFLGYENIEDIEDALRAEERRRNGFDIPPRCPVPRVLHYSQIGQLSMQIQRYIDIFGVENILVNRLEDIATDPASVYRDTLRFLGVDQSFMTNFEIINSNKIVRYTVLRKFTDSPSEALKAVVKRILPQPSRRAIKNTLQNINTSFVSRSPLRPRTMAYISDKFSEEVRHLDKLLTEIFGFGRTRHYAQVEHDEHKSVGAV